MSQGPSRGGIEWGGVSKRRERLFHRFVRDFSSPPPVLCSFYLSDVIQCSMHLGMFSTQMGLQRYSQWTCMRMYPFMYVEYT